MASHGIVLPTRGVVLSNEFQNGHQWGVDNKILGMAKKVDDSGLDSVWVGDSIIARPRLEPLNTLAAVGAVTESVDLGAAVYLPTMRHPLNVAHQTATVDRISGGRLILGVGVGVGPAVEHECDQVNVPYHRRGALLDETLNLLDLLWKGETNFSGEFFEVDNSDIGLYPSQNPLSMSHQLLSIQRKDFRDLSGSGLLPMGMGGSPSRRNQTNSQQVLKRLENSSKTIIEILMDLLVPIIKTYTSPIPNTKPLMRHGNSLKTIIQRGKAEIHNSVTSASNPRVHSVRPKSSKPT